MIIMKGKRNQNNYDNKQLEDMGIMIKIIKRKIKK
jgi:hypothetical protein